MLLESQVKTSIYIHILVSYLSGLTQMAKIVGKLCFLQLIESFHQSSPAGIRKWMLVTIDCSKWFQQRLLISARLVTPRLYPRSLRKPGPPSSTTPPPPVPPVLRAGWGESGLEGQGNNKLYSDTHSTSMSHELILEHNR